jgi:putative ABC transport system ATP-binding protein
MKLVVQQLAKRYGDTVVFQNVSFELGDGEFVAIMGESGVGKSTLLHCIAGLDDWDSGSIRIDETDIGALDADARALLRRRQFGFVFQAFHVLPQLDVAQNVALPLMLLGRADPALVSAMLDEVGLARQAHFLPQQLSGGQLQRVAIARALVHGPALLLADEPTGNLDPKNAAMAMDLMVGQTRRHQAALLLATHSAAIAAQADRILELRSDGLVTRP